MAIDFPTLEWVKAFKDKLNSDEGKDWQEAAKDWEGDFLFVIKPDGDFTKKVILYVDLWHGECRNVDYFEEGDEGENNNNPEPTGNPNPEPNQDNNTGSEGISELDRAEAINKEKARLLEEEKKLIERKEKLESIRMVGGQTIAGQKAPEVDPKEKAKEYGQSILKGVIPKDGKSE